MTTDNFSLQFFYYGEIVPKPRMTQQDVWLDPPRPCVEQWRKFKTAFLARAMEEGYRPARHIITGLYVTFVIPRPRSWTKTKRKMLAGQPHEQTPDLSNLIKAVEDALTDDDSKINILWATKIWSSNPEAPSIDIEIIGRTREDGKG
jgi:Holliday junction resolvase RusA-like endonuclease